MGYVKNALARIHEEGCLWLSDNTIQSLRDEGLEPATRNIVVEGWDMPVEVDALPVDEALRILPLTTGEDREEIMDALSEWEKNKAETD